MRLSFLAHEPGRKVSLVGAIVITALAGACGSGRAVTGAGTSAPVTYAAGKPAPPPGYVPSTVAPAKAECTNADLHLVDTWGGGLDGYRGQAIEFQNSSHSSCFLAGLPAIRLNISTGSSQDVTPGAYGSQRLTVPAGQYLFIAFGVPASCTSPAQDVSSVGVLLPGGTVDAAGKMILTCGPPKALDFAASPIETGPSA